jgi:transcriptional regulator with XRE-family HTH domain
MEFSLKSILKLSDRLKYIRLIKGLSQVELAEMATTTQQAIQQAETGKARNPRYLHKLSQALGIPFEWLALNEMPVAETSRKKIGLSERENEMLQSYRSLPKTEQEIILDIMKARQKKP